MKTKKISADTYPLKTMYIFLTFPQRDNFQEIENKSEEKIFIFEEFILKGITLILKSNRKVLKRKRIVLERNEDNSKEK